MLLLSKENKAPHLHFLTEVTNYIELLHKCTTIPTRQKDQLLIT